MMKNPYISKGMSVVVLGFGVTGRAAVRYLHGLGARVFVSDARPQALLSSSEKQLLADCCAEYEGGGHSEDFLDKGRLIFVSPGISTAQVPLARAVRDNIPIVGELALASPVMRCKTIAITGTNGKTTVTTLIGELLKRDGKNVFVGGNIGRPLFEYLMDPEDKDIAVIEVSSFQLELSGEFRPDIAMLLNITPDHIDRHGSMSEYMQAKARIFGKQGRNDFAIFSADNILCLEMAETLENIEPLFFGHSKDCQAYICESEIYLRMNGEIEIYALHNTVFDNHIGRQNSAAAIFAARTGGCSRKSIEEGLASFVALPHRMQMVEEINGVAFCNDSKATNTGAVISALQQVSGNVVLIAGGRDKGDNYGLLKDQVAGKVKKLVLIGEAAQRIAMELAGVVAIEFAQSMDEAVRIAAHSAVPGDTVLLSPACASFDMFNSYGHRGEVFSAAVRQLKEERTTAEASSFMDNGVGIHIKKSMRK